MVFYINNYKLLKMTVSYEKLEIVEGVCTMSLVSSCSEQNLLVYEVRGLLVLVWKWMKCGSTRLATGILHIRGSSSF